MFSPMPLIVTDYWMFVMPSKVRRRFGWCWYLNTLIRICPRTSSDVRAPASDQRGSGYVTLLNRLGSHSSNYRKLYTWNHCHPFALNSYQFHFLNTLVSCLYLFVIYTAFILYSHFFSSLISLSNILMFFTVEN